jgi:hypothetical protein
MLIRRLFVSFPCSGRTWLRHMFHDLGVDTEYTHDGSDHKAGRPLSELNPTRPNIGTGEYYCCCATRAIPLSPAGTM